MKREFVGNQTSKTVDIEGGDFTVLQPFQYLNSVLARFEQLMNCPYSQQDVEAIKTVFQTRLDAISNANVPGDLLGLKRSILDRVRGSMPTSVRYLIPFWLVAILLIVVAVCCKIMYAM